MANFGFRRLAVVAPYEEHWREAKSAVQAKELLQNARCVERLAEAVADCSLVIGTGSLTHRKPEQPVVPLPALAPLIRQELARSGRVALVFGPEKRGLTREDFSFCHLLVEIPTAPRQPSMNLGQAVAVCLYELSARAGYSAGAKISVDIAQHLAAGVNTTSCQTCPDTKPAYADVIEGPGDSVSLAAASAGELERLAGVVEMTMLAANYSPRAMREANRHDLRLLLRRLALTERDARRILGLFRRILWRLER